MRFAVRYPTGAVHEVELHGTVAILGRDPTCDLVLNDVKCSRRHAVIEADADGLSIRDTGSSNGVFVNGKRLERSRLRAGDVVGLGDVMLTVLEDDTPRTLSMGGETPPGEATAFLPKDFVSSPAPAASGESLPSASPPWVLGETGPQQPARALRARPLTVTVLALLWMVSGFFYLVGGVVGAIYSHGLLALAEVCGGVLFAAVAGVMAWGLLAVKSWARVAQIVLAALGLPLCPFSCASVAITIYMIQAATRASFAEGSTSQPSSKEGLFTAAVLASVVLGAVFAVILTFLVVFFAKGGALR